jgi:cell division protein FtsZ
MFEFEDDLSVSAKIKVVGIGGGGGNAIKTMMRARLEGIDFTAINTDVQALKENDAPTKIQIGTRLTKGLGAGANPEIGREAALEDASIVAESFKGVDMVFVTAGMGGGTGTGAAPIIARVAKEVGVLTVGVVTKPFSFEGKKRMRQADEGIIALKKEVDTLICIPNDNLLNLADKNTPIIDSFKMVDHVLLQAVRGISDLITTPGLINLDFADVNTIMRDAGVALMGTGVAAGENRAIDAARLAISSPLLENISISGATGLLLNITGSSNMTLFELNEACKLIQQEAHEDANIIFGSVIDDNAADEISVTVIATGFDHEQLKALNLEQTHQPPKHTASNWLNSKIKKTATPVEKEMPPIQKNPAVQQNISANKQPENDISIEDVFSSYQKEETTNKHPIQNTIKENLPLPLEETPLHAAPEQTSPELLNDLLTERKKPVSPWGGPTEPQPRAKRPEGNRITEPMQNDPVIQEVNIDGNWSRRPTKNVREQSEFRKTIRELSSMNMQEDDVYDIPAFIRRRAD